MTKKEEATMPTNDRPEDYPPATADTGSTSPTEGGTTSEPGATEPKEAQKPAKAEEASGDEDLKGKMERLEAMHEEDQKMIQRQGQEIGALRPIAKEFEKLRADMQRMQQPVAEKREYSSEIDRLANEVTQGDKDAGEAFREASKIIEAQTREMAELVAQEKMTDYEAYQKEKAFLERNPEYLELLESGELERIATTNPDAANDPVLAYFIHRNEKALAAVEETRLRAEEAEKQAFEKGKASISKVAQGAEAAGTVLSSPGESIRQTAKHPRTRSDEMEGGLAALRKAREET